MFLTGAEPDCRDLAEGSLLIQLKMMIKGMMDEQSEQNTTTHLFDGVLVLSSISVTESDLSFSYSLITFANAFVENDHLADGLSGSKFGRSSAVSICRCSISIF